MWRSGLEVLLSNCHVIKKWHQIFKVKLFQYANASYYPIYYPYKLSLKIPLNDAQWYQTQL